MDEYELDYDVQEVRLSGHVFKVTTMANDALPLEMLMQLQTHSEEISGQRLWEGSLLLCDYLAKSSCCHENVDSIEGVREAKLGLRGKSVLELGAGTGVVGMLAHSLGARPVVMTDGDDKCVVMAQKNTEENNISPHEALVTVLRWGEEESTKIFCEKVSEWEGRRSAKKASSEKSEVAPAAGRTIRDSEMAAEVLATAGDVHKEVPDSSGRLSPSTSSPLQSFDFILAGDVLYKHCLLRPFLGTVRDMLAPGGRMFLCHVPRAGVSYDIVERAFDEAGFAFEILNGDRAEGESSGKEAPERGAGAGNGVELARESYCDTAVVGGVELCVDDARRARLYELHSGCPR